MSAVCDIAAEFIAEAHYAFGQGPLTMS